MKKRYKWGIGLFLINILLGLLGVFGKFTVFLLPNMIINNLFLSRVLYFFEIETNFMVITFLFGSIFWLVVGFIIGILLEKRKS